MNIKKKTRFLFKVFSIGILFGAAFLINASENKNTFDGGLALVSDELPDDDESFAHPVSKLGRVNSFDRLRLSNLGLATRKSINQKKNIATDSCESDKDLSFAVAVAFDCDDKEEELADDDLIGTDTLYVNSEFAKEYKKALDSGSGIFGKREYSVFSTSSQTNDSMVQSSDDQSKTTELRMPADSAEAKEIVESLDDGGSMVARCGSSIFCKPVVRGRIISKTNDVAVLVPSEQRVFSEVSFVQDPKSDDDKPVENPLILSIASQVTSDINNDSKNINSSGPIMTFYNGDRTKDEDSLSCWQRVLNCFCCRGNKKQ